MQTEQTSSPPPPPSHPAQPRTLRTRMIGVRMSVADQVEIIAAADQMRTAPSTLMRAAALAVARDLPGVQHHEWHTIERAVAALEKAEALQRFAVGAFDRLETPEALVATLQDLAERLMPVADAYRALRDGHFRRVTLARALARRGV